MEKMWSEELDDTKGKVLRKLWKERERAISRNKLNKKDVEKEL